jgi:hypothetical protein
VAKTSGRAVIQQICEHHRGDPPEVLVPAIMNALKGHGLHITADPAAAVIEYCGSTGENRCIRVRLQNGRCPVCGWTPNPDKDA